MWQSKYQEVLSQMSSQMTGGKLDVHREIHVNAQGCRVVTLEGEDVCLAAWRHIMGVPQTTFYCYVGYISEG